MRAVRLFAPLLTLCLVSAAAVFAAPPESAHPLDGLSAKEIWAAYDVLQAAGHVDDATRFASVLLHEPPKGEVLAWKPGAPFRREASAVLLQGPKAYEAVVDVARRKLVSWKELQGAQPNMVQSEEEAVEDLMKHDPDVIAAFKRRGIVNLATIECYGTTPGYFGAPEEEGRRLVRAACAERHGVAWAYGRPIEGVNAVVDLRERKILRVIDTGQVPVPAGSAGLDEDSVGTTRPAPPPIALAQPQGPAFSLKGHEVAWQNWSFQFRLDPRRGLIVSNVRYQDGPRARSVLYQGSLSEIFVPYMDPAEGWYYVTYLDLGEYSGFDLISSLEPGLDCPDNAVFFDTTSITDRGLPRPRPRAACLFERSAGEVAWRHLDEGTGVIQSRPQRDLVLRMILTAGNYDYIIDWTFEQNGAIRIGVGATGIVAVKAVPPRTASLDPDGRLDAEGRGDPYGRFVAENTVAVNHDHFFSFRLDLDVDGTANSLEIDHLKPRRLPPGQPRKSIWVVESQTARAEKEGQLHMSMESPALWRFVNPAIRGPMGYPVSYEIMPDHNAMSLLAADDLPERRAAFVDHTLWVTPYRPEELYAAGDYPTQSHGGDGLPAWTAANRPIENTDIVAWYTVGFHHVVRAEDWPVTGTTWHGFTLRPFDFFARNAALDLPKKP